MSKEWRVAITSSRQLASIGADTGTDLAWFFWDHGWNHEDEIYRSHSEPDWAQIARVIPPATWLLGLIFYQSSERGSSLQVIAKKPNGDLYLMNEDHLVEICQEKYPAREGENTGRHFERALEAWIKSDDVDFSGSMFRSDGQALNKAHRTVDLSSLKVSNKKWEPPKRLV